MLGIKNGYVKVEKEVIELESSKVERGVDDEDAPAQPLEGGRGMETVALDSNDELFKLIRDQNIEQLGPFLQSKVIISLLLLYSSIWHS